MQAAPSNATVTSSCFNTRLGPEIASERVLCFIPRDSYKIVLLEMSLWWMEPCGRE